MTIVQPRPLRVRIGVTEAQLPRAVVGQRATVVPTAYPNRTFAGRLIRVDTLPLGSTWDALIDADVPDDADGIVAGMTGKATVIAVEKDDAIAIPHAALQREDDGSFYVHVKGAGGDPEKRPVTVGQRGEKTVEITDGLSAGDSVKLGPVEKKNGE